MSVLAWIAGSLAEGLNQMATEMGPSACPGCGIVLPSFDGAVHPYMEASPACWHLFREVLAREYSDAAYREVYRLAVDAYAVQHPGRDSRQAIQSVGVHLVRLCLFMEHGLDPGSANDAMLKAAKAKALYHKLERPAHLGKITVADVASTTGVEQHKAAVRAWAHSAWSAWAVHHHTVRRWAEVGVGHRG